MIILRNYSIKSIIIRVLQWNLPFWVFKYENITYTLYNYDIIWTCLSRSRILYPARVVTRNKCNPVQWGAILAKPLAIIFNS